jgi:hypothetical protein
MRFVNSILKLYLRSRKPHIRNLMEKPEQIQRAVFKGLIAQAKNTEFGKKYDFATIKDYNSFAERIPLGDYETHKDDIKRMMEGECNILWKGCIEWFSKSSGTTSDSSKFIPVSNENLHECHIQGPKDSMTLFYYEFPNATVFNGKGLIMGGAYEHYEPHPETKYGDVSSIMIDHIPMLPKKMFYTPSMDIALMPEFEEKIEKMAQQVIHEDVTNLGGVPTWTIVLFRRMLEITGKKNILEIWPNLQVYFHGGVSFDPYEAQFKELLPGNQVKFFEVYNASEGYFASQCEADANDMLLLLENGIFFEFLPTEEWNKENPKAIPLWEVEKGKNYAVVITTNSGLWRYQIGDTVTFTSVKPYKIQISGRTKHFINVFGEEVMVSNTDDAIATTSEEFDILVRDYTVAPIFFSMDGKGKGGHEWIIEFDEEPLDLAAFEKRLDQNLQMVNSDYAAKRYKNMALEQLKINKVPQGTFNGWLKSKGKYGGQSKIPRLANTRKHFDEIMEFLERSKLLI